MILDISFFNEVLMLRREIDVPVLSSLPIEGFVEKVLKIPSKWYMYIIIENEKFPKILGEKYFNLYGPMYINSYIL